MINEFAKTGGTLICVAIAGACIVGHKRCVRHLKKIERMLSMPIGDSADSGSIIASFNGIKGSLSKIEKKLSMPDNIVYFNKVKFYVPNFPSDLIQAEQVNGHFFEQGLLEHLNGNLNTESVVLDIGANVGNHTVYWSKITGVKKSTHLNQLTQPLLF